jgi:bifunctional DNase/RNase
MTEKLHRIRIKKVLGPTQTGTAVLLGNDEKTFVMFIGIYEGAALIRELQNEAPARPLTHELLCYILTGFDIEVKHIIISDILENTFCATLVLQQIVRDESEQWVGKRNEVRIDARPSDCLVIALKEKKDIFVTPEVLEKVRDISEEVGSLGKPFEKFASFGLKEFELDMDLKQEFDGQDFDLDQEEDEDSSPDEKS